MSVLDLQRGAGKRISPRRVVICGVCQESFALSYREYDARTRGVDPICWDCRHPPKPLSPAKMARLRAWWLERFTLDELREIAFAFWPELRAKDQARRLSDAA